MNDPYQLREKPDNELYTWVGSWKQETSEYIAGMQEIRRRSSAPGNRLSKFALGISVVSLVVAILVAIFK